MSPSRYRHIIWDWNGTLLDDVDFSIEVMNGLLRRRGLPLLDRPRYHRLFDFPVRTYYERVGLDLARESFEQLSVEWISAYEAGRATCRLQTEAAALLRVIQSAGIAQSILSAYPQKTLQEIVAHFGLSPYFVRVLGLDNIYAHSKAELGRAWVAELALPAREILLVGDTLHDFDVASQLGIDCVLVAAGHQPAERLRGRNARILTKLSELRTLLGLA
jgi:phosphoglycolate phosphatase